MAYIGEISTLVAILLAAQHELTVAIDPVAVPRCESATPILTKQLTLLGGPTECHLGVDFVHVLTTGAAASGGRDQDFSIRDRES